MSVSLKLGKLLKSLVHIRRIKNAKVLNPLVLMGIVGKEAAPADEMMWGEDPVHPKRGAYVHYKGSQSPGRDRFGPSKTPKTSIRPRHSPWPRLWSRTAWVGGRCQPEPRELGRRVPNSRHEV